MSMKQFIHPGMAPILAAASLALTGCAEETEKSGGPGPNILWIYVEDLNPFFSCYDVDINPTPNIDKLAENGVLFTRAITPTPVCSPTRSGIITGSMPTTLGLHNHHSSRTVESAIFLPDGYKTIPELFREAGYYTFNHGKDDYNFIYDRTDLYNGDFGTHFWYTFEGSGHWSDPERQEDQPFFGQIQLEGGKNVLPLPGYLPVYDSLLPPEERMDPAVPDLPPYYPNHPVIRKDWAMHYDAARITDKEVGFILQQLKEDGLLDNTYVFFFSDHGYKGIRHKQFCYEGGINIPLIVAYFGEENILEKGSRRTDLVSGIDIGTTSMALSGIEIPDYMEGQNVFAPNFKREFVIATRDRCDFTIDRIRAVRTKRFKYIRNFMPERSYQQPTYRDRRPEYTVIRDLHQKGKLNDVQAFYWKDTKPEEELYRLSTDPHEIHNLAEDPAYKDVLEKHRRILEDWIEATDDQGQYPEGIEALRFMVERWGERCVNPEFDTVRLTRRAGAPQVPLK